jgi:hypothetical protein
VNFSISIAGSQHPNSSLSVLPAKLVRRMLAWACFLLPTAFPLTLRAQVYEVAGGTSSLYQASGGTLTVTRINSDLQIGAGIYAGHFQYGAQMKQKIGPYIYVAGDDHLDFHLPTDIFDASHFLYTRGLSVGRHSQSNDILLFGGVDSPTYNNPLFLGGKMGQGLGFLSIRHEFSPHWQLFSDTVIASKQSEIAALQWTPQPKLTMALSAGVGANQPYAAASLAYARPWFTVKSSYVQAGNQFHRFVLTDPILAEPQKENVLVTISPLKSLTFTGAIQNYLVPLNDTAQSASSASDEAGINFRLWKANFSGALYESKFQGEVNHAGSATFQRNFTRRLRASATYMASRPEGNAGSSNLLIAADETINSRFSINQSVDLSAGKPVLYYGGAFQANLFSVSANYETFYVPARPGNPFENALMLDLTVRLFGRYRLHGQTNLSPTGHLLYTADAYGMASRGESLHAKKEDLGIEKNILRLRVVDDRGAAIEGAALLIDQRLVYSDSQGSCFLREHSSTPHHLTVALDQFLTDGNYVVVSSPETVKSSAGDSAPEVVITLKRVIADSKGNTGH